MIYLLSVRFTNCLHSRVHLFCPLSDQAFAVVLRKQQYLRMKMVKGVFAEEARLELVIQKGESSDKEAEVRGWLPAAGLTFLICPYLCVCVCVCVCALSCSVVPLQIVTHQAPLSMEFLRQEYWSGLSFPTRGYLLSPGIKSSFLASLVPPALAGRFFTTEPPGFA